MQGRGKTDQSKETETEGPERLGRDRDSHVTEAKEVRWRSRTLKIHLRKVHRSCLGVSAGAIPVEWRMEKPECLRCDIGARTEIAEWQRDLRPRDGVLGEKSLTHGWSF